MFINVTPALTTQIENESVLYISAGQSVIFTNYSTGGTGFDINTYFVNGQVATPLENGSIVFNTEGTYQVTLGTTDASGEVANDTTGITVTVTPVLTTQLENESALYISAGQSVIFTNYSTGGTGDDINTYFVNGVKVTPLENGSIVFPTAGTYTVTLGTTDATGEIANDTTGISVTVTPPLEITLTANWTYISQGQSVLFTNQSYNGTGSNVYWYTVNCGDEEGGSIVYNNTVLFTRSGTCTVTEHVTDASGEYNQSNVTITITPPLTITSFSNITTTYISAGQSVTFSNTTTGGTQNDTWTYFVNGVPTTPNENGSITFPTSGYYNVSLGVTDTTGEIANSTNVTVDVTPPIEINLTANWTYISAGQSVLFTTIASGGTGGNIYNFTVICTYIPNESGGGGGGGGASGGGGRFTLNFPNSGTCTVTEYVRDASGETNQSYVDINVTPALTITSFTQNRSLISVGQGVVFSNTTTGGTQNDTWAYQITGGTYTIGPGGLINFTQVGNYTISLGVEDQTGEIYNTTILYVNVTPPLTASITANWTYISAGQEVSFTNYSTGGTGGIINTYTEYETAPMLYYTGYTSGGYGSGSFYRSASPINAAYNDATLSEGFSGSTFDISLAQNSSNGYDLGFYYNAGTLGSIAASGLSISATGTYGVNLWINVQDWGWTSQGIFTGLGSDGAYGLGPTSPSSIDGSTSFYITAGPCSGTTYTVSQLASGACASFNASTPVSIWIGVGPESAAGTVSASITTPSIGTTLDSNVTTFPDSGNYTVALTATDVSGETNQSYANITVTPALTITSFTNLSTDHISVDQSVTFANTTTGGTYNDTWTYFVNGVPTTPNENGSITFPSTGTYNVSLGVTDTTGEIANSTNVSVTVTPPLTINLTANWTYISQSQQVKLTNITTGGTGSNTYNYTVYCYYGDEQVGESYYISNNTVTLNEIGRCRITIHVKDASGETNSSIVYVNVTPPLYIESFNNIKRTYISAGQSVTFSNTTTGGTQNDTWTYFVNGVPTTPNENGSITFPTSGYYNVSLGVTDTTGEIANSTNVTVD